MKTAVMNSIYFYIFFLAVCSLLTSVQGSSSRVPRRSNEVLYREQQQHKPGVAKYVDGKYQNVARNSSRRLYGRHVCTQSKVVMVPVKDMQSYCKPMYQSYLRRCDKEGSGYCTGYRVVYELAYRSVQMLMPKTESLQTCCPGWTQTQISASDCKKAICSEPCRNGGICTKPDHCTCPPGWTGKTCETDVDECARRKHSCEHECSNTPGSYRCFCRDGFILQSDRRSCKKEEVKRNSEDNLQLLKEIESLRQRLSALEEWQRRLLTEGTDGRHPREDRINSLSEQIAIIEETLEECNYHVSALRPYEGGDSAPLYPIRSRGRPRKERRPQTHPNNSRPSSQKNKSQGPAVPTRTQPPRTARCMMRTYHTS